MAEHVSDATLLERFVTCREEAAFAAVVRRHGSIVRAACRRVLASEHDAEDVVQATFLVLAMKASEVPWRDSVGGWLCAVARRLALNARAGASKRSRRETSVASLLLVRSGSRKDNPPLPEEFHPVTPADPCPEIDRDDLRKVLDDELRRLPEKYREPVVLCDLEGLTHAEAARRLGLPAGSMSRRLGRARALLRQRLAGRDLPVAVVVLFGVLVGLWSWERGLDGRAANVAVREAMAPFARPDWGGLDLEPLLARARRGERSEALRGDLAAVAGRSELAAQAIEGHDVGRNQPAWRSLSAEMRSSALLLAQAARETDDSPLLLAARRLNTSCVQCHLAYRQ